MNNLQSIQGHMDNDKTASVTATTWFYLFIFCHILLWTIAPLWVRSTLPMDAMEGTTWGQQSLLGYDKNPFLNAWLTALAVKLGGYSGWMTYLFSQLSVAICFWAVWRLGKKFLSPTYSLVAVLLLESLQYYNFHAIDFNDNTLELSLWALTILFFYQAVTQNKLRDWLLTGCFAGFAMMAKYYTIVLLIPMLLFLLSSKKNRTFFQTKNCYLGLGVFIAIITPHFIWLASHQFVTFNYAVERVSNQSHWQNHFNYAILFSWQQLQVAIPALIIFATLLYFGKTQPTQITTDDKKFLLFVGAGPLLLTVLLSAIMSMKLRAGWGQPLLSLLGIMLIVWFTPRITPKIFYRFLIAIFILLITFVTAYCIAYQRADKPSSANYPGKMIAKTLTAAWHARYPHTLAYVAGPRWIGGNIALYSADHPAVYMEWNPVSNPTIQESKLHQHGAVFVWDNSDKSAIPPEAIQARFPTLSPLQTMTFPREKNKNLPPIIVRVAFLPPESTLPTQHQSQPTS